MAIPAIKTESARDRLRNWCRECEETGARKLLCIWTYYRIEMTKVPRASGLYPLINYQLPGGASRLAALLLPYILPVCSVVAPCHPGAALRNCTCSADTGHCALPAKFGMAPNVATAMQSGSRYELLGDRGRAVELRTGLSSPARLPVPPFGLEKTYDQDPTAHGGPGTGKPLPAKPAKTASQPYTAGTSPAGPGEKPPPIEQVRPDSASGQPPK